MFLAAAIVSPASHTTTIPVDNISGIIVVSAMVNGKGPFHFALDTGSATVVVTPAFALELALPSGEPEAIDGAASRREVAIKTGLAEISIAGVAQSNVEATILPLPPFITDQGHYGIIDGLIGYSFLKNYALSLNLAEGWISLTPNAEFVAPAGATALPMQPATSGTPAIELTVDGAAGRFAIDTGTQTSVVLASSFVEAHSIRPSTQIDSSSNGIGGSIRSARARLENVTIGGATIHNALTELLRSTSLALQSLDGAIGYGILHRFTVTLDYAGRRVFLEPFAKVDAYEAYVGTGIERERSAQGTVTVVATVAGSPAARAGIRRGDEIVAIDGHSVSAMSNADYDRAAGTSPGASAIYTLRSGNARRNVTLKTVDLLPPVWPATTPPPL